MEFMVKAVKGKVLFLNFNRRISTDRGEGID